MRDILILSLEFLILKLSNIHYLFIDIYLFKWVNIINIIQLSKWLKNIHKYIPYGDIIILNITYIISKTYIIINNWLFPSKIGVIIIYWKNKLIVV